MRLGVVVAGLIAIACAGPIAWPAQAKTLLQGIEQSLKGIDRQLCSKLPSAKCKQAKIKTKQMLPRKPKAKIAAPLVVPKKAVPVTRSRPPVPAVVSPILLPEAPPKPSPKPATVPRATPPLPKLRPADLNAGPPAKAGTPAPRLTAPVVAPSPPLPPAPPEPPPTPPVQPAKPSPPVAALPVTPPVPPPAAGQASACLAALAAAGTSFTPVAQPSTSSSCTIDNPVRLNSISTKPAVVKLPDQPTVNCAFALKLSQFVGQRLQPLAVQSGSAAVAFGTGPGFDCRGRNGDSSKRMSEHAIGDAVDIVYLKLANKSQILVKDALNVQSPNFAFLRDLRALACQDFTTVLGPGANAAHAEHFHIDLEARRGDYRICE